MDPYLRYLPLVLVLIISVERGREMKTNRQTVPGVSTETASFKLLVLCGVVFTLGCIVEYVMRGMVPNWPMVVVGVLIVIVSFVIRRRAIVALGRFWSFHVEIRESHEFVKSGPFRWMRHPTYFSMILEFVSLALILNAWLTLMVVPFFFIPALLLRLKIEEAALIEKFGDTYREYRRRTPALFPYKGPCN